MWHLYAFALLAGIANAIEPGQNATLAKVTGQPMLTGIFCFGSAALCLLAVMIVMRLLGKPAAAATTSVPLWAWPGGVLGAVIVLAQLYVSEQLGAASFLGCVVTAGVIGSIILDHYGLLGFERHRATRWRIVGGTLMIAGVTLVVLF